MPSISRPTVAFILCAALLAPSSFSFDLPLSEEAVREAYFLGQRNDDKTAEFFDKYVHRLPVPDEGPQVASIQLLTPYANVVELSRQHSLGNSAQDALEQYKKHGDVVRVVITIQFTASYNGLIEKPTSSRSDATKGYEFRSYKFWRDFSYRLFQKDKLIEPLDMDGHATYSGSGEGGSDLTGAVITLLYDANKVSSSDDADIVIDTIAGQQIVETFDLASLR
jgi:hypothetical protein